MARRSTKSKSETSEIISVDDILKDRHVKVLTPTDKRLTFFVRLTNDQVWEINPTTKPMKALLREYRIDNFAMEQVWPDRWMESVCFEIQDFIKDILRYKHQKQLSDTKIIFGPRAFCQWWYITNYAGYGQRHDIYSPNRSQCMNEAVTRIAYEERDESGNLHQREEWRCEEHRNNTTLHEVKTMVTTPPPL
jgi:hypothetical protein